MEDDTPYVHILWWGKPYPEQYQPYLEKWSLVDPELKVKIWDDVMIRQLLVEQYPRYLSFYNNLRGFLEITDFARLMILHAYGGVYADTDIEPMRSVLPLVQKANRDQLFILGWEPKEHSVIYGETPVCNCFMIGSKGHPFPLLAMDYCIDNYNPSLDAVRNTGPLMLKRLYDDYHDVMVMKRSTKYSRAYEKVWITPSYMFMPVTAGYTENTQYVPAYSHNGKMVEGRFINHVSDGVDLVQSYTIHHWKVYPLQVLKHQYKAQVAPSVMLLIGMAVLLYAVTSKK